VDAKKESSCDQLVEGRESGFASERKATDLLEFPTETLGQHCPSPCPQSEESPAGSLGEPITIREVAALIGCSVWTVRQRCLREGLPHFRASRSGRLIFYRNQVVRWLIEKQIERRS